MSPIIMSLSLQGCHMDKKKSSATWCPKLGCTCFTLAPRGVCIVCAECPDVTIGYPVDICVWSVSAGCKAGQKNSSAT